MTDIENDVEEINDNVEDVREDLITAEQAIEDNQEETEETELSKDNDEVTEKAKKFGHLSKEDWVAQGRDPKQWKSPEEFNRTGDAIEQIIALRKRIDQRDRELEAVIEYQKRTAQREYERAKQDLESRLSASKDDMDIEGVAHYTKELTKLEQIESSNQLQLQQEKQNSALNSFIERNQHWYNDRNPDLVNRAVEIDNEIKADINAGRLKVNSLDDIAVMIEKRLAYEHPDRVLGNARSQKPPTISNSSVNKTAANKVSSTKVFKNLSQEHRDTFNVYKRMNPNITEAEFINRLKQDGEI